MSDDLDEYEAQRAGHRARVNALGAAGSVIAFVLFVAFYLFVQVFLDSLYINALADR